MHLFTTVTRWGVIAVAAAFSTFGLRADDTRLIKVYISGTFTSSQSGSGSCDIVLGTGGASDSDGIIRGDAYLYPGKSYQLTFNATGMQAATINVTPPGGYRVFINKAERKQIQAFNNDPSLPLTETYDIEVRERSAGGTAGSSDGLSVGDLAWGVNLGRLYNGTLAGSIVIRSATLNSSVFDRGILNYQGVYQQVSVIKDSQGRIRQVIAPEVFVDLVDVTDGFRLDFYPLSAMGTPQPGGVRPVLSGSTAYVSYTIKPGSTAGELNVERTAGDTTQITSAQQGVGTWLKSLQDELSNEERIETTNGDGDRVETIVIKDGNGVIARKTEVTYHAFSWNLQPDFPQEDEIIQIVDDPDGKAYTTKYSYYDDAANPGSHGRLKSVVYPDGRWAKYDYYDDDTRLGQVKREYHPWKDLPAGPDQASEASCRTIDYDYAADWDGAKRLLSLREEKVQGVTIAKDTSSPTVNQAANGLKLWAQETRTYTSSIEHLTTTTKQYQPNQEDDNSLYNGLLYSVTRPDQTKESHIHQRGNYDSVTQAFTLDTSGTAMREIVLSGTAKATVGTSFTSYAGATVDEVRLIAGRSTKTVRIRQNGRIVREEVYVFTGAASFERLGWTNYAYTDSGRLRRRETSNGGVYSAEWIDEFKTKETTEDGVIFDYSPDALQRVANAVKASVGTVGTYEEKTIGTFPAQLKVTSEYTYDAAGHITKTEIKGGLLTLTATASYNPGGRLVSQTGADGYTTTFADSEGGRVRTVSLPGGATRVVTSYLDGKIKSVTGTAQVAQHFDYSAGTTGFTTTIHYGSSTSGAWEMTIADWVGRIHTKKQPTSTAGSYAESTLSYNTVGQLKKNTQPGRNPTVYTYDDLGALEYSGLDVDDNGLLTPESKDRISKADRGYVKEASTWWWRERSYLYPVDDDATATKVSEVKTRLTGFTDGVRSEQRTIDAHGNETIRTREVDPLSALVYDVIDLPYSTIDAEKTYHNGLLVEVRDGSGETMRYVYDAVGRPAKAISQRKTAVVTTYHATRNLVSKRSFDGGGDIEAFGYDAAGRVNEIVDGLAHRTRKEYNARGQLIRQWGDGAYPVSYDYDSLGRLTTQTTYRSGTSWAGEVWPGGTGDEAMFAYYGDLALLKTRTDAVGNAITYTYDTAGRMETQVNARNQTITFSYYPEAGELKSRTYPAGFGADVTYTYNRFGGIASVTDATGTRSFSYDTVAGLNLEDEVLPSYFGAGRQVHYSYNATAGAVGRLAGIGLGTATATSADQSISYGFTADGRVETVTVHGGSIADQVFTYDYETTQPSLVKSLTVGVDGLTQTRSFHPQWDVVTAVTTQFGTETRTRFDYTYNSRGQRDSSKQSGSVFADYGEPTYYRYAYNGRGELLTAAQYMGTDVSLQVRNLPGRYFEYEYDAIGNRSAANHTGDADLKENYVTNALNQITSKENNTVHVSGTASAGVKMQVTSPTASSAGYEGQFWSAEATLVNNTSAAKQKVEMVFGKAGAGTDGKDILVTSSRPVFLPAQTESMEYDADGNLTLDGRWRYFYNASNELVRMETRSDIFGVMASVPGGEQPRALEFTYDYLGRRVSKKAYTRDGTNWKYAYERRYLYQGWNPLAEIDENGTILRHFFWGLDITSTFSGAGGVGALLMIQDGTQSYFPAYDGNGNVAALLKADGVVVAAYEYSPFGEQLRSTGSYANQNPFRWSTKFTDAETGLVYYGRRYYDPKLGHFVCRDPIEESGGINLYAFVQNDPVNAWDYNGMRCGGGFNWGWFGSSNFDMPFGFGDFGSSSWHGDVHDGKSPEKVNSDKTDDGRTAHVQVGIPVPFDETNNSGGKTGAQSGSSRPHDPFQVTHDPSSQGYAPVGGSTVVTADEGVSPVNPSVPPLENNAVAAGGVIATPIALGLGEATLAGTLATTAVVASPFLLIPSDTPGAVQPTGNKALIPGLLEYIRAIFTPAPEVPLTIDAKPVIPGLAPGDVGLPPLGPTGVPAGWVPHPNNPGAFIPPNTPVGPRVPQIHPDPTHPVVPGVNGPHVDWAPGDGTSWRVYPNGDVQPKNNAAEKVGNKVAGSKNSGTP